jgi:hypothetical protein
MLIERYGADSAMPDVLNEITACERNFQVSADQSGAAVSFSGRIGGRLQV